jgi:hypothetical protein
LIHKQGGENRKGEREVGREREERERKRDHIGNEVIINNNKKEWREKRERERENTKRDDVIGEENSNFQS